MADLILVEDEAQLRRYLGGTLRQLGHTVRAAETAEEGLEFLSQGEPDLILTDHNLPGISGQQLLERVKESYPAVAVILLTAHGTVKDAVHAMRTGASDYLNKPVDRDELELVLTRCLESRDRASELAYYRSKELPRGGSDVIIGESESMQQLRGMVATLAEYEKKDGGGPTVLLSGETGTGKGLVARALHQAAARREEPFVEINCAALPGEPLEAELMGYEKGAFTGATASKMGLFEAAQGGTIFLDEIGRMPMALQAKLLKVIDERSVRRLGSTRDRELRCSVVTASSLDLAEAVEKGEFVIDLYHRVNVFNLHCPGLRERGDDILRLANHFLSAHASEYGVDPPQLSEGAEHALLHYAWPGNIRELRHTMERLVVLGRGGVIEENHPALLPGMTTAKPTPAGAADGHPNPGAVNFDNGPVSLEEIERELIEKAYDHARGNRAAAARLLCISKDTLRYRLEKFNIS